MYIKVRVTPNAKKESIMQLKDREYAISVREPAERNLANMRIREIMAEQYDVVVGKVHIISGHRSPSKIINIDN